MMRTNKWNLGRAVRNIVRTFADAGRTERPPDSYLMREIGIPGGKLEEGVSVSSYNPELAGPAWFAKVDEMLLSSSQAAVVELVVTLPIVSAEWRVEGGSDELRQLVDDSLFSARGMSTTWREVLYNACQSAIYGTAVFEIVWKEMDGALGIRRLIDRDPSSVDQYTFDRDGGLAGIVQKGTDPETGDEVEQPVKIDKLLLFPYRLRRREYHGRSILRPAYRHFESIAMLCTFADIGLDHSLVGVPIGKAPPQAKAKDIAMMNVLLSSIRRHESSGLILPSGWDLVDGVKLGGSDSVGFLDYIQWHEGALLRAALASFMQLGSTATGTKELAGDLLDFSLMSWGALADMIAGVINRHLVRRICDYHAQNLDEADYPELISQPIDEMFGQRRQEAGQYLGAVANGEEALPADRAGQEEAIKTGLGLPDGDDRAEGAPAPTPAPKQPSQKPQTFAEEDVQGAMLRVRADSDAAGDSWQAAMTTRVEALLGNLLRQVDLAGGEEARLAEIRPAVGLVEALAGGIAEWLAEVRVGAATRLVAETGTLPPAGLLQAAVTEAETARGQSLAWHLAEEARFAVVGGALRGEALPDLAREFAAAVEVRLRGNLTAAARAAVEGVNRPGGEAGR